MLSSIVSLPFQYISAFFRIISDFKLLLWCIIPYLLGIISFLIFLFLSYDYRTEIAAFVLPSSLVNYGTIFAWALFVLNWFVSAVLSIFVMLILGGFFIENFIDEALRKKGLHAPPSSGMAAYLNSLFRGLKDSLLRSLVYGILALLIFTFSFFPPLAFLVLLFAAFAIGYDLLDMPLSLLGFRAGSRLKLIMDHKLEALVLGALFSALMLVPLGGIIFLPLAYMVAVDKVAEWEPQTTPSISNS